MTDRIVAIAVTGGINEVVVGFVTVAVTFADDDGNKLRMATGQLPPHVARDLGLDCFVAAKAAETLEADLRGYNG